MKTMRKILMVAMTLAMVMGFSVAAYASQIPTTVSKIVAPKSATVYTNDDATKELNVKFVCSGDANLADFYAVPKNRGIVNVVGIEKKTINGVNYAVVKLNPIKNGTTSVTLYNKNNTKVKGTTSVKVMTYADGISFGAKSSVVDGTLTVVANGKLNLYAAVSNDASNKKLTYKMTTPYPGVSVDKSGNILTTKSAAGANAEVTITSADKKATKKVAITVIENKADGKMIFVKDNDSTAVKLGELNKKNSIELKSNAGSNFKTYQIISSNATMPLKDLTFSSSNDSVATVNSKGLITAVKAGKATITVTSKTGVKLSNKINVKVTTDVEVVNASVDKNTVLANGKDVAKITVASNSAADIKKVKYTVLDGGKNASVDKNGNFKAKKSGSYIVIASISGVDSKPVIMKAIAPTTKVTVDGTDIVKNSHTITIGKAEDLDTVTYALRAVTDGEVKNFTWSSSNEDVAAINASEDGQSCVVTPVSSGKAKLTVKANDGSGKAASVNITVKVAAYEVTSDKAVDGVVYVTAADNNKAVTVNLASVIAAKTNANATNKAIKYIVNGKAVSTVKVDSNASVKVTAKSADGATCDVDVKALAKEAVAQKFDIAFNSDDAKADCVEMFIGDKKDASATVTKNAEATGIVATNLSAITYKSNNANVVSVDKTGKLTAKKAGVATVTASFKNPYDASVIDVATKVYVGSKDATIKAALDSVFASVLKEENRDWTGIKTAFNAKKSAFTFSILDFKRDVTSLENTGLNNSATQAGLKLALTKNINIVEINVYNGEELVSSISRAKVLEEGLYSALETLITEAIGGNTLLEAWVGSNYTIEVVTSDNVQVDRANLNHKIRYNAEITATAAVQSAYADVDIATAIETAKESLPAGISNITYNAATRTATVYANNPKMTFVEAQSTRDALVASIADAFKDVAIVDFAINVEGMPYQDKLVDVDGEKSDDAIKSILDGYTDKLVNEVGAETYADADGTVATAVVTFKMGQASFKRDYTIEFVIDKDYLQNNAEDALKDAFDENKEEFESALGNYVSVESVNNGTAVIGIKDKAVGINDKDAITSGINRDKVESIIKDILDECYVDETAEATVMMGNKKATLTKESYAKDIIKALIGDFGVSTLGDLVGKTVYVKVPVKVGNTAISVAYTIEFVEVVSDSKSFSSANEEPAMAIEEEVEAIEEVESTEEVIEEVDETVVEEVVEPTEEIEAVDEAVVEEVVEAEVEAEEESETVDETVEEAEADSADEEIAE